MESSSQATIDALLEELNAKDEHIKQLGAEMARMAFSADVRQSAQPSSAAADDREAAAVAEARRECRVLKQQLEQKERELEHALGLRRKLGDSARKVSELRALLDERERELRELRESDNSVCGDRFSIHSGVDALAMEELRRELEETRARAAAAEDGQRTAQARVASLTKALEDARRRPGKQWVGFDRTNADQTTSSSPASWARAALQLDSPELETRLGREPRPEPESEEEKPEVDPGAALFLRSGEEDVPPALQELCRRFAAGELSAEEAKMVQRRLYEFSSENGRNRIDRRGQECRQNCVSTSSADNEDGVPAPEELMDRQHRQRQRQQHDQEDETHWQQQRAQQREEQAAIVRSWGRTKEGEAARQKIRDQAHEHRIGWLKSGQVMQKFAWSSEKVQPRFVKLSTDSSAICWGSSMTSKLRSVPLRDIRDVYYGFTSEVFRRREAVSPLQVKEWHCFSLQLPDRTLDFAAPTDQEAVAWTICLRTLCYSQGVWEAGKQLVMGDVLWKRAALKFDDKMWAVERKQRRATDALQMSRQDMEQLAIAVASAKLRRLYDAIEAGVAAAAEERSQLGYSRGEELAEDPAIRKEKHMAQLAEMRRRELRASARNFY